MKKFDFNTIEDFDKHIELSIPNYRHLADLVTNLSTYFINKDTLVYDLGCSTGTLIKHIQRTTDVDQVGFVGIDMSKNLLPPNIPTGMVEFVCADLCGYQFSPDPTSFVILLFTLQFMPVVARELLLAKIRDILTPDGAVVVAEKVYMPTGFQQDVFTFAYYDFKSTEFTSEQILSKQIDLRSIMHPLTREKNQAMFHDAGFRSIPFFQSLNFVAWLLTPQ